MRQSDIWNFLFAVICFGLVIFWPEKKAASKAEKPVTGEPAARPIIVPLRVKKLARTRRYVALAIRILRWLIVVTVGMIGLTASIAGIWGPFWPVDPEIKPQNVLSGMPLLLPFTIKNNSSMIDIVNAELRCRVDLVIMQDARHERLLARDMAFATGGLYSIKAKGPPLQYQCDASGLIRLRPDGRITLFDTMESAPSNFRPPLTIEKMCVWIMGTYTILGGRKSWSFTSNIFQ